MVAFLFKQQDNKKTDLRQPDHDGNVLNTLAKLSWFHSNIGILSVTLLCYYYVIILCEVYVLIKTIIQMRLKI